MFLNVSCKHQAVKNITAVTRSINTFRFNKFLGTMRHISRSMYCVQVVPKALGVGH